MKKVLLVLGLLIGSQAQAHTIENVFLSDSVLPKALQHQILSAVTAACPGIQTNSLNEEESNVDVVVVEEDQGQSIRKDYTTRMHASVSLADRTELRRIYVDSVEFDNANPRIADFHVRHIWSDAESFCNYFN